jgi:hypothetical protein
LGVASADNNTAAPEIVAAAQRHCGRPRKQQICLVFVSICIPVGNLTQYRFGFHRYADKTLAPFCRIELHIKGRRALLNARIQRIQLPDELKTIRILSYFKSITAVGLPLRSTGCKFRLPRAACTHVGACASAGTCDPGQHGGRVIFVHQWMKRI